MPHPDPLHFVERANNEGGAGFGSRVEIGSAVDAGAPPESTPEPTAGADSGVEARSSLIVRPLRLRSGSG
jgi:hypothetical protein